VEKILIAHVCHTCCFLKILTGGRKMKANAIMFETPIPKVHQQLSPPRADIDDVLVIFFSGPCQPFYKCSLVLVRRNHVGCVLEWLKLNHSDYLDIDISYKNLAEYSEDGPPCSVEYKQMSSNQTPEGTSVHDMDDEDGTDEGDCAYMVHRLTGQKLDTMTTNHIKALALKHLNLEDKFLVVGHSNKHNCIQKCFHGCFHMVTSP
jgi:hypothetical protein